MLVAFFVNAQEELMVFPDWTSTDGSQNFFYKNIVKTDASGAVYVAGATVNDSNNLDILVAKYNSSGALLWIQQYNGPANGDDMATGLYIDGSSNVYLTGTVSDTSSEDVITIRYNSAGTLQWVATYDGSANDFDSGSDITVIGGNVYITGTSLNASANTDVVTIKYNSSGVQQWVSRYDYASLNDAGVKITCTVTAVIVSCVVQRNSTTYRCGVLTYNLTTGALISATISNNYSSGIDQVNDMVKDGSGNIYIAGATPVSGQGYDYNIIKLNTYLAIAWQCTYNGPDSLDDVANGIKLDAAGNVYVTGYSTSSSEGKNITTIKYNSSGTQQWIQHFNDTLDLNDQANAMIMDQSGNLYIAGYLTTESDSTDYLTLKYNSSGDLIWQIHSDGDAHLNDKATNIAIDTTGDIIVTGESETAPGVYEYCTVKYVEKEVITPTDYDEEVPLGSFEYYRNKGQLLNTNDTVIPEVKYYSFSASPAVYIKDNSHSYVFAKVDTSSSTTDTLYRVDIDYTRKNSDSKTYSLEERKDYLNYFLGHCPEGITEIRGNQRLVTTDLYDNIDLMFSSNQNGIKQYYIIKPGGDPTDIAIEITGADSVHINGTTNALSIITAIDTLTFERPTVYQLDTANNIIDTLSWTADWETDGASNKLKFNIGGYDNSLVLVIQVDDGPNFLFQAENLEWSTFFGGSGEDAVFNVTTDKEDNFYAVGYTKTTYFPVYNFYQGINAGGYDAFITCFHPNNVWKWATLYGGSHTTNGVNGTDGILDIVATDFGLFCTGNTQCTDFPTFDLGGTTYFDGSVGNSPNPDAFILNLNYFGIPSWCTYFGDDDSWDEGYAIDVDDNNCIYVAGWGQNTGTFPLHDCTGCYFQDDLGSSFIAKFNSAKELIWSTLFTTRDASPIYDLCVDDDNSIFVTGSINYLNWSDFTPANLGGGYSQPSWGGGGTDAFIAKFLSDGSLYWSTLFGGAGHEEGMSIDVDKYGKIYFTGSTNSQSGFPLYNPGSCYYDGTISGEDAFIARFGNSGSREWVTYYGGDSDDFGGSVSLDGNNYVYISGGTNSTNFPVLQMTDAYYQEYIGNPSNANNSDAFILAFSPSLERVWSTYFGGKFDDICITYRWTSSTVSANNKLYLSGVTNTDNSSNPNVGDFPLVNPGGGAYYEDHSTLMEVFISKFDLSPVIGINENTRDDFGITVYPNPNYGDFTLSFWESIDDELIISVYNTIGVMIFRKKYPNGTEKFNNIAIDLPNLHGVFIVEVKSKTISSTQKVIIL